MCYNITVEARLKITFEYFILSLAGCYARFVGLGVPRHHSLTDERVFCFLGEDMPTELRVCPCGKSFYAEKREIKRGGGKYCSRPCYVKTQKGSERTPFIPRFWAAVNKSVDGCWLWQGMLNHDGYGAVKYRRTMVGAHRVAWILERGEIPKGLNVLHRCDVRRCVNPDHLFLGTQRDNVRDMDQKGRANRPGLLNKKPHKLSPEIVREIKTKRRNGVSQKRLAKEYGVSQSLISRMDQEKVWAGVKLDEAA